MDLSSFKTKFTQAASTIIKSNDFIDHARGICVVEQNYLALFALDIAVENRKGKYRKDDITPDINHQAQIFFQLHAFHENDKANPNRGWKYLPDRPDLDKALAWLHDEGEDERGLNQKELIKRLNFFINNIDDYVQQHNQDYPYMALIAPNKEQVTNMRNSVDDLVTSFDIITKKYKDDPNPETYHNYHQNILGVGVEMDEKTAQSHARACRVKVIDKAVNIATLVYRSKAMVEEHSENTNGKYREWVVAQINKMKDIYFNQPFEQDINQPEFSAVKDGGFIQAIVKKFSSSAPLFHVMNDVLTLEGRLYDHNLANESQAQGSPPPPTQLPEYDNMALSDRTNLIKILQLRLEEVQRIDANIRDNDHNRETGLFDIEFKSVARSSTPIPLQSLPLYRQQRLAL